MAEPLFSVVVPTYNRAEKLLRCLKSLNEQTYFNFEVCVCDDGSGDNTKEMVESFRSRINFKQLHYFFEPNWGGPARPRNIGVQNAAAEWICFLDADDAWHPEKLKTIIPFLDMHDLIYHDFILMLPSARTKSLVSRQLKSPVFNDQLLYGHNGCIINSGVCVRKNIIQKAGGFCEDRLLIGVEDADLWLKISRITNRFKYVPVQLGCYFMDGGNITVYDKTLISKLEYLFNLHCHYLGDEHLIEQARRTNDYQLGRINEKIGNYSKALALHTSSLKSPNKKLAVRSIFWICYLKLKISLSNFSSVESMNQLSKKENKMLI
jgi:glycosyltransferase involved in cell wall biosynthesis